jgi:signal transduction histidine kinase
MASNIYSKKQLWKLLIFLFALLIGAGSLYYTNKLVKKLEYEERKKVELWAEATKQLASEDSFNKDINFLVRIIQDNETVPVILTDKDENILAIRNLDTAKIVDKDKYLQRQLNLMKEEKEPIVIDFGENNRNYIFYKDSTILTQLSYYPMIQLGVIILFILISYYAFSISRKAEQNQVWLGLSKETAHQLGTPTSSLMAWIELMKLKKIDNELIEKFRHDINRLEKITARFSKIGSSPKLRYTDLNKVINNVVQYLTIRFSERVTIIAELPEENIILPLNEELFEWVVENICKNAHDAIEGKGSVTIQVHKNKKRVYIDISDTGKGIPKSRQRQIFKPGYTTKKRGWGLGLSLSKRIVVNYHSGKIFVHNSEVNKGSTIRITLKLGKI